MKRGEYRMERSLDRWRAALSDSHHDPEAISLAQRHTTLIACAFGVPTLLCLWVYALLYQRENLFLLYLPLVLAGVILGVTLQALSQQLPGRQGPRRSGSTRAVGSHPTSARPARPGDLQQRLLSWSVLLYTLLCLGYRAVAVYPQQFGPGLDLLVALLVVVTGVTVCARFRPLRAGLTLALLTGLHVLPLLGGLHSAALSGGPLLLAVVTELMLATVLALMYSASWTQLALGQSEAASVQMAYLSRTDHLTRLANRRSLYDHIEALMAEIGAAARRQEEAASPPASAARTQAPAQAPAPGPAATFSVILLDIDHFKAVNDTFGHATGDLVLCGVADVLQSFLRRRDVAGRWGGEEFLLLLPGATLDRATRVAERLRARIESSRTGPLPLLPGQPSSTGQPSGAGVGPGGPVRFSEAANPGVTASFGVACYRPGDSLEALLTRADAAMYRAKRGGRNRVESGEADLKVEAADMAGSDFKSPPDRLPGGPQSGGSGGALPGGAADAEQPARELTGTER